MKFSEEQVNSVKQFLDSLPTGDDESKVDKDVLEKFVDKLIEDETAFEVALDLIKNNEHAPKTQSGVWFVLQQVLDCE